MRHILAHLTSHRLVYISLCFVVLLSFLTYFYSAPRTNIGYGDSDELITIGHLLGVAHPSGYPLVVILIKLFTLLPIGTSIAFRAHILAMLTHSLTVGLIALSGVTLSSSLRSSGSKNLSLLSILPSLFLAFSAIFWLYGGIVEVGSLNNFFAGILIFSTIKWQLSTDNHQHYGSLFWLFCMFSFLGIGLATVQTFILLVPGVVIAMISSLWHTRAYQLKKIFFPRIFLPATLILFVSWLIPNLLLFWLNGHHASLSWVFDQNLNGWWRLIARRDYTGTILDQNREVSAYIAIKPLSYYLSGTFYYLKFLLEHMTWPVVCLTLIGLYHSWKIIPKPILATAVTFFLVSGVLFGAYMGVPQPTPDNLETRLSIGILQRQYQLGHISFGLLSVLAITSLAIAFTKTKDNFSSSHKLLGIVVVLAIIFQFCSNYSTGVQRNNQISPQYARNMLDSAEPNSVIICFSDNSCYSLLYEQLVENYRPDVTVLIKNNYYRKYFLTEHPQYEGYTYGYNPFFAANLISWNTAHRTTYLTEPDGFYSEYMGFDANPFYLIPHGYLYQVSTQVPQTLTDESSNYKISETLAASQISPKNYFQSGLKDYFAYKHLTIGFLYSKLGYKASARYHLELAIKLNPQVSQPRVLLSQLDQYTPDQRYAPGTKSPTAEQILAQYYVELEASQANQNNDLLTQAYKTLMKAVFIDPQAPEARMELAKLYQSGGYAQEGQQELEYILKYNPDFSPAKELLQQTPDLSY